MERTARRVTISAGVCTALALGGIAGFATPADAALSATPVSAAAHGRATHQVDGPGTAEVSAAARGRKPRHKKKKNKKTSVHQSSKPTPVKKPSRPAAQRF